MKRASERTRASRRRTSPGASATTHNLIASRWQDHPYALLVRASSACCRFMSLSSSAVRHFTTSKGIILRHMSSIVDNLIISRSDLADRSFFREAQGQLVTS